MGSHSECDAMADNKDSLTPGEILGATLEAIKVAQADAKSAVKTAKAIAVDVSAKREGDETFIVAAGKQYVIGADGRIR